MLLTWFDLPVAHYEPRAKDEQNHNAKMRTPLARGAVELSDGSLHTVYYQKWPGDSYCSILASRWTLPEK